MTDNGFIKNTVILGFSSIAVKLLSAVYRIPLTRMIGAEGMGQYTAAFNFFMPFFSLATAGITPAISRLCAANSNYTEADIAAVKEKACRCFGTVSLSLAAAAVFSSYIYSGYIDSPVIFIGVALLSPNLMFATFEAVYKGIAQGTMNMAVSAKAGLLESGTKTVLGICSVYLTGVLLGKFRSEGQLIRAFATVSISGLICLCWLHGNFAKKYKKGRNNIKLTYDTLFSMAVPVSLSALVVSLSNFCDTVICLSIIKNIPDNRLMASYPFISFSAQDEKAIWLYGVYQGLCLSVVNLIPSLSAAVGASGLPVITKALNSKDSASASQQIDRLVRFTAALVVPVSLFTAFFAEDVLITLYGHNGAQTVLAARFLTFMAPVAVLSAFSFPLNSIMHATGRSSAIFRILLFSCAVKVAVSVGLCSVDIINIMGCIVSQTVFHILVFALSVNSVKNVYPVRGILGNIIYPAMLSYVLLSFIRAVSQFALDNVPVVFRTFFCGGFFVLLYFCLLFLFGFFVDNRVHK